MNFRTVNPATEQVLAEYTALSLSEVDSAITGSYEAFAHWRKVTLSRRLDCVGQFGQALTAARLILAELITVEMGKTKKESLAEVDKCMASCKVLQDQFPRWLESRNYNLASGFRVTHEPLGPILGIMPWNFPLWQVLRFALPALLCGNSVLLKHAPNTWGTAKFIADLFAQVFPEKLYIDLPIDVEPTSQVLADRRVRGVSLTGSRQAGIQVGRLAAENLKKCVLELGGSDAYIILDDADLDASVESCVASRLINAGQSCVAAKRFIVTKKNADLFTQKMLALMKTKIGGDPMDPRSDFGPLARQDLRRQLHRQVERSVAAGAHLTLGGTLPTSRGFYYPASVLTGVQPGQPAFDEELFGPVAAVIEARDEAQALAYANQSRYGLGAAVFSRDVERATALATTEVEAGMVFVNDFVKSDATAPFGGVKDSGLGRELGRDGCFEFTNIKSVFVKPRSG